MAEELGLDDVRAALLNIVGTARVAVGDESGLADLEQSLAIGLELSLAPHLHRTYHNLMESYRQIGRLEKSAEVLAAERRSDERFGLQQHLRWVLGEEAVTGTGAATGKRRSLAWTNSWPRSRPARLITWSRHAGGCAPISARSGRPSGADEDSARNVEMAREQKDLQVLAPGLARGAFVLIALGRSAEASDARR